MKNNAVGYDVKSFSSVDLAVARGKKLGTLRVEERSGRFGPHWVLFDDVGVITCTASDSEAELNELLDLAELEGPFVPNEDNYGSLDTHIDNQPSEFAPDKAPR